MPTLIEITTLNTRERRYINMNHVISFYEDTDGHAVFYFVDNKFIAAAESYKTIVSMLVDLGAIK